MGSTDRVSAVSGAAPLTHTARPHAMHHNTRASFESKLPYKQTADDRHVQIVEASSRNGALEPTLSQAHMEQHQSYGMDLRNGLTTWVESARSKLGMHTEEDGRQSLDKTTANRGAPESTSDAISVQQDSITMQQHTSSMSVSSMPPHGADGLWRGSVTSKGVLDRRDSVTSSVFTAAESPHSVARRLLEDLARMTKAWLNSCHTCLVHLHASIQLAV